MVITGHLASRIPPICALNRLPCPQCGRAMIRRPLLTVLSLVTGLFCLCLT
jgi:hypothetical protein